MAFCAIPIRSSSLRIPDDVHVLRVDFDFGAKRDDPLFGALSDCERHRVSRFVRHADAIRFAACRTLLRYCLAAALGRGANSIRFAISTAGRPSLYVDDAYAPLDFNVSHSGKHALIAWSKTRRVGVDIELLNQDVDWEAIASSVLGTDDARWLEPIEDDYRQNFFFDIWVAKEALLKAYGSGISAGLTEFSVAAENHEAPVIQGTTTLATTLRLFQACWLRNIDGYCSGLMTPDTNLGENTRHEEVSDEQATSFVFSRIQAQCRVSGA